MTEGNLSGNDLLLREGVRLPAARMGVLLPGRITRKHQHVSGELSPNPEGDISGG